MQSRAGPLVASAAMPPAPGPAARAGPGKQLRARDAKEGDGKGSSRRPGVSAHAGFNITQYFQVVQAPPGSSADHAALAPPAPQARATARADGACDADGDGDGAHTGADCGETARSESGACASVTPGPELVDLQTAQLPPAVEALVRLVRAEGLLPSSDAILSAKSVMMPSMSYGGGAIVQEAISPVADLLSRDVYCTEAWTCLRVVVQIMMFNVPMPRPNMDGFESSKFIAKCLHSRVVTFREGGAAVLWRHVSAVLHAALLGHARLAARGAPQGSEAAPGGLGAAWRCPTVPPE